MEKTILQNMYNFSEPKVALVSRKDSEKVAMILWNLMDIS